MHGDNVTLTLRPAAQRLALTQLAGRCGAVVALDAKTGAVYAMASSPTYNENLIEQPHGDAKIAKIREPAATRRRSRTTRPSASIRPGSTFKMVTAAAALDSGAYTPSSQFNDPGYCTEYGQRVSNAGNPDQNGPEAFGNVTLAQGFEHSINSVFCNIGMHIGGGEILKYAKRFGFYSVPPLDTPPGESSASGLYRPTGPRKTLQLWDPKNPSQVDAGRLAFGQFNMLATPLQMALVGATIANKGVEPKPYLVQKIVAAGRLDGDEDGSADARPRAQAVDGRRAEPDDAARRPGRDGRKRRVPFRPPRRRQDGNRGARARNRLRLVVRLLRAREQSALRHLGGGGEAAERVRRLGRGADREGNPRKAPGPLMVSLPFRPPWQ